MDRRTFTGTVEGDLLAMPEPSIDHHSQLPATPFFTTISVTASGVSAENVVATIAVPASHHGIDRCERK